MSHSPIALPLLTTLALIVASPVKNAAPASSEHTSQGIHETESAQRRLAVDKVLVATQIPEGARLLNKLFLDQAANDQRAKALTAEQKRDFNKFLQLFFNAEAFEKSVRSGVTKKTADMPVEALIEFSRALDTPLVRRMPAHELATLDARERNASMAYRQQLKKKLPPQARLELAGRYVRATGNAEQIARINEVVLRRMLVAGNPSMDAATLETRVASLRPKLIESAADEAVASTLTQFRKVDDRTLRPYVELLEQPTVAPIMKQVGDVVAEQMDQMMGRVFQVLGLISAGIPLDDIAGRLSSGDDAVTSPRPPGEQPAIPTNAFGYKVSDLSAEQKRQLGVPSGVLVTVGGHREKPEATEVEAFYSEHPELFSDRRIYTLRGLDIIGSRDVVDELRTLTPSSASIEEIARRFQDRGDKLTSIEATKPAEALPLDVLANLHRIRDGEISLTFGINGAVVLQRISAQPDPIPLVSAVPLIEAFIANERALLRPGDVVVAAIKDGVERLIQSAADFHRVVSSAEKPSIVTLYFRRDERMQRQTLLVPGGTPVPGRSGTP